MAQFPTYNRRVSAPSISGTFQQRQVNTEYAKSIQSLGGSVDKFGTSLQEIDDKVTQIDRIRKAGEVRLSAQKAINQSIYDFNEDEDPNTWDSHIKTMEDNVNDIISSIDDPVVRDQVSNELLSQVNNTKFSLLNKSLSRKVSRIEDDIKVAENAYIMSADTNDIAVMNSAKKLYVDSLNDLYNTGNISKEKMAQSISEADRKRTIRAVNNAMVDSPETATQLLDDLSYNLSPEEEASLRTQISKQKTKDELILEEHIQTIKLAGASELSTNFNNGTLSYAMIDSLENSNPIIKESGLGNKYRELIGSTAAYQAKLDPSRYMSLIEDFYNIKNIKVKDGKTKIGKLGAKEFRQIFDIQSRFIDAQINGDMTLEESNNMNKMLNMAIENNPDFVSKFSYMNSVMQNIRDWSSKTFSNAIANNPSYDQTESGLAAELYNNIVKSIKPNMDSNMLNQAINEVKYEYDKVIAHRNFNIVTVGDKEMAQIGDAYYPVNGYSNGEPVVDMEKLDADNTK